MSHCHSPVYPADDDDLPIWAADDQSPLLSHNDRLMPSDDDDDCLSLVDDARTTFVEGAGANCAPRADDTSGFTIQESTTDRSANNKKWFFWIRWVCHWPKLTFGFTLLFQLSFLLVTLVLYATQYNIFPMAFNDMPMENTASLQYRRYLAWKNIYESDKPVYAFDPSRRKRDTGASVQKFRMDENIQIFYQLPNNQNILTAPYLKRIKQFESVIEETLREPFANSDIHLCNWKHSIVDAFDENLTLVKNNSFSYIQHYLEKTGTLDVAKRSAFSSLTRSDFYVCYYDGDTWDQVMQYCMDVMMPKIRNAIADVFEDINAYVWNFPMYGEAIKRQVFQDLYLFIGSVTFIFLFILLQTASFWITFWGTASIVVSFLGANIIYDCIFGYKYFGIFNVLALFIVLGLGADDIFIFLDTWRSMDRTISMEKRLSLTYRKAMLAMFNTSLTTLVAFFTNAFAPLLPIRTFGIFAGLTVFVNFMSVVVFFPTVVAVHHRHFEKPLCCKTRDANRPSVCARVHKAITHFFGTTYFRVVTHRVVRWIIVAFFLALMVGMSVSVSYIRVDDSPEVQIFVPGNENEKARTLKTDGFKKNMQDIPVTVLMVWGLKPRDMTSCDPRYYKPFHPCPGVGVYDDKFNLEKEESQLAMKQFCQELRAAKLLHPELKIDTSECFIERFEEKLKQLANITLPVTNSKINAVKPLLKLILDIDITGSLETPFSTMLYLWSQRAELPNNLVAFERVSGRSVGNMQGIPIYNERVQFVVGASVTTSMTILNLGIASGEKLERVWETFMENQTAAMPFALQRGFQLSYFWFKLYDRLSIVSQGIMGISVSLALAFGLILLATQNIILALLSIITLSSTVICVIGVMPIAGWKLGILEGLNMAFVAGLSVDYILHLVQAYRISSHEHRLDRTQEALHAVGVSIFSGALTTLGSSAFIMFSRIDFFLEFGVFIFCTVGFSVLHAMLLFPALLSLIGPSRNQGYLLWFCKDKRTNNTDYIHADEY